MLWLKIGQVDGVFKYEGPYETTSANETSRP